MFPQHADEAEKLIEKYLGYVPFPTIYLPHEVFIRSLIAHYKNGQIAEEDFQNQLLEPVSYTHLDVYKRQPNEV